MTAPSTATQTVHPRACMERTLYINQTAADKSNLLNLDHSRYRAHCRIKLEDASTRKSANTHTGRHCFCLVTLTFDRKINGFPGLIVKLFYVKFSDPSCIGFFRDILSNNRRTKRQTDRQTNAENMLNIKCFIWFTTLQQSLNNVVTLSLTRVNVIVVSVLPFLPNAGNSGFAEV